MIKINKIKETTCVLLDPDGDEVGIIESCLQLNDVRLQIMRKKLEGYKILWFDKKHRQETIIYIDKTGYLDNWYAGFFDEWDIQLEELIGL